MNIIRRIFGKRDSTSDSVPESIPEIELTEDPQPQTLTIPGVTGEIDLTQDTVVEKVDVAYGVTRQLPTLESALASPNQHVLFGYSTDVGMVRTNNQDAVLAFFASQSNVLSTPDFGIFIVADGMGGHHDGEKASAIATQVFVEQVMRKIYLPMLSTNGTEDDPPPMSELLTASVKACNEEVVKHVPDGGTTITAVTIVGDLAYLVHVGDSRAYLLTADFGMEQITRDHSLVQRLIELDQLTPEEASRHPQKNVLYRAIGQSEHLEVDTITRRLPAKSHILLCSDGLWNMVPESAIMEAVSEAETPQQACDRLVAVANEHGGADNISVVLLQIPE